MTYELEKPMVAIMKTLLAILSFALFSTANAQTARGLCGAEELEGFSDLQKQCCCEFESGNAYINTCRTGTDGEIQDLLDEAPWGPLVCEKQEDGSWRGSL